MREGGAVSSCCAQAGFALSSQESSSKSVLWDCLRNRLFCVTSYVGLVDVCVNQVFLLLGEQLLSVS